jgi:hypothetical protein
MAVDSNIFVKLTTEFNGKALAKGQKQLTDFEKTTKKVGKTLGAAFAVHKIVAFGKSAVSAFLESEKAGKALNQTLNNLGMAYKSPAVDMYLNKLSLQVGIVDEQLKPAYNSLLIATHDTAMAQSLLNTALDVSAGTGKDLTSVVAALSKGYLGNNTALQRLGVGLSKAELSGSKFSDLVKILNDTFQGQASAAAQGYTGDVMKLGVAYDQLKQSIGKGILTGLDSAGSIDQTTQSIVGLGNAIGYLTGNISKFVIGNLQLFKGSTWVKFWNDLTGKTVINPYAGSDRGGASKMADARAEKLSKTQANTAKLQTAAAKAQLAATKAQTLLDRSGAILDIQQAEIYAALQGKITDNERLRLDLQLALLTKNSAAADQLSQELLISQLQTTDLAKTISALPKALNPFSDWPQYIQDLIAMLANLAKAIPPVPTITNGNTSTPNYLYQYNSMPQSSFDPGGTVGYKPIIPNSNLFDYNLNPTTPLYGYNSMPQSTFNINIDATSMIDPANMTTVVQNALLQINKSGLPTIPAGQGF